MRNFNITTCLLFFCCILTITCKSQTPKTSNFLFLQKELVLHTFYNNDSSLFIYSKDSIGLIKSEIILQSDLLDMYNVLNSNTAFSHVDFNVNDEFRLSLNGNSIILKKKITDVRLLKPTMFMYVKRGNIEYVAFTFNLISFMSNNYWWNIVLRLDANGQVEEQYIMDGKFQLNKENFFDIIE